MTSRRLTPVARKLRHKPTEAEERLWFHLRGRRFLGLKFRRQMPVAGHVADFACEAARLVVEADGGQHSGSEDDAIRTAAIEAAGYRVLRFWNHEVLAETDAVLAAIADAAETALDR